MLTPERTNWHLDPACREEVIHTIAEAILIVERLSAALAALQFARKDLFEFRLALEEAAVNGLKHGNQGDPHKGVRIRYCLGAEAALAEVEDDGPGFNPKDLPDPTDPENLERSCGRGIFLIKAYMSWVRFNERGNRISFCKLRTRS